MQLATGWNRSSALDPHVLGTMNVAIRENAQEIAAMFAAKADAERTTAITLTDEQFTEMKEIVRNGITTAVAEFLARVETISKQ